MDPVSLGVAITAGIVAVGATLVALCRKQISSVNNNHDIQSMDGVEVNIGGYDKRTETFPDGRIVVTEKVNPTMIKIHETDSTVAAIGALSRADGYNTNTVAGMNSNSNALRNAAAPALPAALPNAPQAPAAAQQPDAQLSPINLQDFANLKTDNRNIFTIQKFTFSKEGETVTVEGLASNTVSDGGSQNDAAHTQLCKAITSVIMPKINAMTSSLVSHVVSSQQMHVQQSEEHDADSATERTPLLSPPALLQNQAQLAGAHTEDTVDF